MTAEERRRAGGAKTVREALAFVERHGAVLLSARGAAPSLAEWIAGEPIRGSWWAPVIANVNLQHLRCIRL